MIIGKIDIVKFCKYGIIQIINTCYQREDKGFSVGRLDEDTGFKYLVFSFRFPHVTYRSFCNNSTMFKENKY